MKEFDTTQPKSVEYRAFDGLTAKTMFIRDPFVIVPQHSHTFDHLTVLASGTIDAWRDGDYLGRFDAPHSFDIPAGTKHMFQALVPNTMMICLHNTARNGDIQVTEEHELDPKLVRAIVEGALI